LPEDYEPIADVLQHPAIMDFPHESGRTAATMILTGMKRRYPNVKIILSHGGGTLPVLSERVAQLQTNLLKEKILPGAPQTAAEILQDAKSFYFDTALAGTKNVQALMHDWAPEDRMLFGSDYPYCNEEAEYNASELETYMDGLGKEERERVYWRNALELFPRLREYYE
jgi:6-methylsalicylate decarboxylase